HAIAIPLRFFLRVERQGEFMRKFTFVILLFVFCSWLTAQQTSNSLATNTAPAASPASAAAAATPPPPHTLLDGTPVRLRLTQTISSADAKTGQDIPFE